MIYLGEIITNNLDVKTILEKEESDYLKNTPRLKEVINATG